MRTAGATALLVAVLAVLGTAMASAVRSSRSSAGAAGATVPVTTAADAPAPAAPRPAAGAPRLGAPAQAAVAPAPAPTPAPTGRVRSRAVGAPNHGRLEAGVLFPAAGADVMTWDALEQRSPNRDWRRVGTDRLVGTILTVAERYRRAHPGAPRVVVGDLSLPQGGHFGAEYGGLGHASHQNGLDVDIAYPRKDRREVGVGRVSEIDQGLAQALVTAFVDAGARFVFVGPHTGLRGPRAVVQPLVNHDDHLHVRIPNVG